MTVKQEKNGETERRFVKRAQRGEREALQNIIEAHAPWMYRLAYSLNGNVEDAEDILQETFLAVTQGISSFKGRSSLKTWLSRILVKQNARHRRYRRIRKTLPLDPFSKRREREHEKAWEDKSETTGNLEIRMDLETMLSALSPEHRDVLVLRELQGFSYREIGEILDLPVGTVESRLFRARRDIRRRFEGYFSDAGTPRVRSGRESRIKNREKLR